MHVVDKDRGFGIKKKCLGSDCVKVGFYKYGFCVDCLPKCRYCGKSLNAPVGTRYHQNCAKRVRRSEDDVRPNRGTKD